MGGAQEPKELTNGAKRAVALAFVGLTLAGLGWADSYEKSQAIRGIQSQLAAAGIDASTADRLNVALAAKKRALTEVDNALVSAAAAQDYRSRQIADLAGKAAKAQTAVDGLAAQLAAYGLDVGSAASVTASLAAKRHALTDVENALVATTAAETFRSARLAALTAKQTALETSLGEASATFAALEAQNRALGPKVADFQNSVVAAEAAARARRNELDGLIAEVEKNKADIATARAWAADHEAMTQQSADLNRRNTDLENRLVALTAATQYRQNELVKAMVAANDADSDRRAALVEALGLRAESVKLTSRIADLSAQRKTVEQALVDVNNRFVPALAAVEARESQLAKLVKAVGTESATHETLTAENADLEARLHATDGKLAELSAAAHAAAEHIAAIDELLGKTTVQAALEP